jgi:hypothetical protein
MITATPARQITAPMTSKRSGRKPSTSIPSQRAGHKHTAVSGQDAAEVRIGLQRRHEAVQPEATMPAPIQANPRCSRHALPDEPRPTDLGQRSQPNSTIDRSTVIGRS